MAIFNVPARFMVIAMQWIHSNVLNNYAATIVVFTLLLKLATLPFDIKQRKNMRRSAEIQPQIAEIQARYKSQPDVLQKKLSKLYKEKNASPTASCLPMIVTLVFFSVFLGAMNIWSGYENIVLFEDAYYKHVEYQETGIPTVIEKGSEADKVNEYRFGVINNIWMPDSNAPVVMEYKNFSKLPFNDLKSFFPEGTGERVEKVTEAEYNEIMAPYLKAYSGVYNGWFILPILTTLAFFVSQLITQKTNPQPAAANPDQPGANMGNSKVMALVMSVFTGSICLRNSAAFGVYWLASSVLGIAVTLLLYLLSNRKQKQVKSS